MKKWKRVLIVGMCTLVLSFTVMSTYQQASEVKAIIGVDDALILIGLLASFGIVAGTYVVGNNAEKLYDELEEGYDATRFTLLEGGGGNPDDPEDDDDNINDENGDGKVDAKDIPTFRSLVSQYGLSGAIKYTPSILACLAPTIYSFYKGRTVDLSLSNSISDLSRCPEFSTNSYPFFVQVTYYNRHNQFSWSNNYFLSLPACIYKGTNSAGDNYFKAYSSSKVVHRFINSSGLHVPEFFNVPANISNSIKPEFINNPNPDGSATSLFTNAPIFDNMDDVNNYLNRKEVIWTTPELQDTYKNEGDFKRLPMRDPNKAYDIPSQQALEDLDNDMLNNNLTDEERNQLINEFINNLKNPNTDPAPGTNPDSPTNPDPDSPTNPDPDNPTNPDPDNPSNPSVKPDGVGSFLADLKSLFPFCIPFDLIDAFKLLSSDSVPPSYTFNISVPSLNIDYDIVVDFTKFEMLVSVFRIMILLMFCIGLILATRGLIKG